MNPQSGGGGGGGGHTPAQVLQQKLTKELENAKARGVSQTDAQAAVAAAMTAAYG